MSWQFDQTDCNICGQWNVLGMSHYDSVGPVIHICRDCSTEVRARMQELAHTPEAEIRQRIMAEARRFVESLQGGTA